MTKKQRKLIPEIKKDIRGFLLEEEGRMVKKDVVKICLGVLALGLGLKAGMSADQAQAGNCCVATCQTDSTPSPCPRPSHCSY